MAGGPLRRLLAHARHHRGRIALAATCSVLNKLFDLAPPVLIGAAVDVVVRRDASLIAELGVVDLRAQLVVLAAVTVAIWALESAFEYAYGVLWRNLAQTIQHELRLDAYGHVQRLDLAWFEDRSAGGVLSVLNDDINQLERFLDGGANEVLQVGTTVVAVSAAFAWVSPTVAALAILPVPFVLLGSFRFQARIAPRYAAVRERVAMLSGQLASNLSGIATIQSFATEEHEIARVRALSEDYRRANRDAIRLSSAFSPLIRMVILVGFTATLVWGGWLALQGTVAVGSYSVLVFLSQRLLWPLTRLGETFDQYQRAMASTSRVLDLVNTPVRPKGRGEPLGDVRGELRFEGVTFAYPGREPVLRDFDLHVPAGRTVGLVGPTGAGKTTVLRLLLRLYEPGDGRVTVDGRDVRDLDLGGLRRAIGYVPQHPFLFSGTARENIRYGTFDAGDDRIEEAARAAEAHGFLTALPRGYDTLVGERGVKLSGGQQQRLSLARAIVKDPPVLVLDEATSAVDNETEAAIQRSIARIAVGRTTLIVAHRLSTVRHADSIVVMDEGAIVEVGTHEELLERRGLYARLWAVQTGA